MILKKEKPNDLVIGYWNLGFFCILVLGICNFLIAEN
jgi:hypothetical protein